MEFTLEFYVNANGLSPVQEFLDKLRQSDPDDFAAVPPLSKRFDRA